MGVPYMMRFMARIAPERFGRIAEGLGVGFDVNNPRTGALICADRVASFIAQFDVPHNLKEAGVLHNQCEQIVRPVLHEVERSQVVDRPVTRADIVSRLETVYA